MLGQSAQASTVVVGNCKGGLTSFTTIQAAVNAVPSGSTIYVCPGYYAEQVTIITNNILLLGVQSGTADSAVITPPATWSVNAMSVYTEGPTNVYAQIAVVNATGVTISHITVDGANNGLDCGSYNLIGIYYENSTGTVTDSTARNQSLNPLRNSGCRNQCG